MAGYRGTPWADNPERYLIVCGTAAARETGLKTRGMNLYLQREPEEILMHRLIWCAEWTDGTRHTLEDAVAFVLRVTAKREEQGKECDVWIEEIIDIPGDDWPHLRRLHA